MDKKKSFILYYDQQAIFELLSNEEAGELIKTIFNVVQNKEIDLAFNGRKHMQMALVPILKTLERDKEKYKEVCEKNRKNAQKRYEKCDRIQTDTNYADSDNESENVNDNESESESENVNDNDISPPLKEDILKPFNVIYGIYPKVDISNKEASFKIYSQYIEGIETVEGEKRKFTPLELEVYIKDYLTKWKEKGNLEKYLPPFQDFLSQTLPYFIVQGLM